MSILKHIACRMMLAGVTFLAGTAGASAETLTLEQAEKLALERDTVLSMQRAQSLAFLDKSVAADTLPDPTLKLGLINFPTDTFARDQEPMTQTRIAIQQMLPRGDSLEIKSKRMRTASVQTDAAALNREKMLLMQVRKEYLELLYWFRAEKIVKQNKVLFKKLVRITQSQYAAGLQNQQDVIRSDLELDMLDDRLDAIRTKQQQVQARLVKLVGTSAINIQIDSMLPELATVNLSALDLNTHPKIMIEDAKVDNSQYGIDLARQSYKPSWMIEVGYGFRDGNNPNGTERADFASAMVSFDIPLFTRDKQDRQVAANRQMYQASMDAREEILRQLQSDFEQTKANWDRLEERLQRYRKIIVPQSKENAKAALYAYQSRRGDFTSLMRAQITELETGLKHIRLQVNYRQAQAKLLYLAGEEK